MSDLTPEQENQAEADLGRYQAAPMPPALNELIGNRIEAHTMDRGLKHRDVMTCIHVAWPWICDWLRDHPGDLAPPARPPGG